MTNTRLTNLLLARARILHDIKEKLAEAGELKQTILDHYPDGDYGEFVIGTSKKIKIHVNDYTRDGFRYIRRK